MTSQDPDRQLWSALYASDFAAAQQALEAGANIEALSAGGVPPFLHFAGEGQMPQAVWLAEHGANINAVDRMRQNALHRLVLRNRSEHVAQLVAMGVDASAKTSSGAPALLLAVVQRTPESMVNALLEAGLDCNVAAASGATPLLAAVAAGHFKLALNMIARGANPHVVDSLGQGVLHSLPQRTPMAFVRNLFDMAPTLDVNRPAKSGTTPLGLAAECMNAELVEFLIDRGADPNSRSANSFADRPTALMVLAYREGNPDLPALKMALQKGADVSLRDNNGNNAAWYALNGQRMLSLPPDASDEEIEHANLQLARQVLELLVGHGLDPKQPLGQDGLSPLLLAPEGEAGVHWIKDMVSLGFPVNPPAPQVGKGDALAPSPLQAMLAARNMPAVRYLLSAGADPTLPLASDELKGATLLHVVDRLFSSREIEQAAQIALGSLAGRSGSQADSQRQQIEAQLRQARQEASGQAREALSELAAATGRIDVPDANGRTPLMGYLAAGNLELASQALSMGADPAWRDEQGLDALGVALQSGQVEAAHALLGHLLRNGPATSLNSLLLDAAYSSPEDGRQRHAFFSAIHSLKDEPSLGQWLSSRDENGLTPLIVAAATAQEDLVDLFLAMGADPDAQDNDGNTALHHALAQHKSDIVRSLRAAGASTSLANKQSLLPMDVAQAMSKPFLVKAMAEDVPPSATDWPMPQEVQDRRDRGRGQWDNLQVRGLPPRPKARQRLVM